MLFGYARHGKDTAAEILTRRFGVRCVSSSWFAAEKIMMPYFAAKGVVYPSVQECFDDRLDKRAQWFDEIAKYNTPDGSRLSRELFAEYDIYIGIRNVVEFLAAKQAGLFDYAVWIDRSQHLPAEPTTSNKLGPQFADVVVDNNGTLAELEEGICGLYGELIEQKTYSPYDGN